MSVGLRPEGAPRVVLASGSAARRQMLTSVGLSFAVEPADVDEAAMRAALAAEHGDDIVPPEDVAEILAAAKAEAVSRNNPGAIVIGADQVLAFKSEIFAKPADLSAAREQLLALRGASHQLHAAVAIARDGEMIFAHVETAELEMRDFSEAMLEAYLVEVGESVLASVGAYQIEGLGMQLFERIDGDYFTILGLPLLPLLAELRRLGVIMG